MNDASLRERLCAIRLVALDVDGVLTDGVISLGATASGELLELKSFHVSDGLGLGLLRAAGIEIAWITGRVSPIVERRAAELGVREVCQGARNKRLVLSQRAERLGIQPAEILYVGDDLNDLPAFEVAGVRVSVPNACEEVRQRADWTTAAPGGRGAVREVVERLLRAQDRWEEAGSGFLARLAEDQGRPTGTGPVNQ